MIRCRWYVALALLTSMVGAACDKQVAGGGTDGKTIFAEVCARCHGDAGQPIEQMRASLGVKDLTGPAFRAAATVESIATRIREGSTTKTMPAFARLLSDEQIAAVASYVLTLPPSP